MNENYKNLPSVERLAASDEAAELVARYGATQVVAVARKIIDTARDAIGKGDSTGEVAKDFGEWAKLIEPALATTSAPNLVPVINCTGVILHSNLGRANLAPEAAEAARMAGASCVSVEYDLATGQRGDRDRLVEDALTHLTGAEGATVVNNNAAALLLVLNTFSERQETIVSRGELIEIGGSFRLPEIMEKSGVLLREVGTTNRTHLADYKNSITETTGLILSAHTSNYRIIGFTSSPTYADLAKLAFSEKIPYVVDLGSGVLTDLAAMGLPHEPTMAETIATGANIVTASGDKLLGGPQCGIIVGQTKLIERIKRNPLHRALRCDKMRLAALETTLNLYRNSDTIHHTIPTLKWLSRPIDEIRAVATEIADLLQKQMGDVATIEVIDDVARAGSGALPEIDIPSVSVAIRHQTKSPDDLANWFRSQNRPIAGRIEKDIFLLNIHCIDETMIFSSRL